MKAMILAAGRGERMRPLTDHLPKPLLAVGGQPLIAWHIQRLVRAGIYDIVINHAWLGGKIEQALGDGEAFGACITYSPESVALETAGGIAQALPLLGDKPFLVVNGDIFTDMDMSMQANRAEEMIQSGLLAHLYMVSNPDHNIAGDFTLQPEGVVTDGDSASSRLTFSGVGLYSPRLFDGIERGSPAKLAPLLRSAMLEQQVTGEHFDGLWLDVGTPERLSQADAIAQSWGNSA